MPIAVTAVVLASRRLRLLLAAFSAALLAGFAAVSLLLPGRFAVPALGLVLLAAGLAVGRACLGHTAPARAASRRIDISGVGTLRLTVQQNGGPPARNGEPLSLLPGTTVWPCCMLLRLRAQSGAVERLVLLPDSVAPETYRALAVALRAQGLEGT